MSLLILLLAAGAAAAAGSAIVGWIRRPRRFAVAVAVAGGVVLTGLALLAGRSPALQRLDGAVARWSYEQASARSWDALGLLTRLGSMWVVLALALLLAAVELARGDRGGAALFLAVTIAGQSGLSHAIKALTDRPRPELNPVARSLGPAFPSGHSASAAVFYGAAAIVLASGRRGGRVLGAAAAALTAAVAATRVLLDVHWLSDVAGGLALGWAWLALTWLVLGRRLRLEGSRSGP